MPTQQKRRSRGGALLTVFVMLFARKYTLAFVRLLSYVAAVVASFYLTLSGVQLGGAIVVLLVAFWFFYAGFRTNKRFEKDKNLTDIETGTFIKAVDRVGFAIFIVVIVYIIVMLLMAYLGRNMFGEMALETASQANGGDYQALFEQLQGANGAELEANIGQLNELLEGIDNIQVSE